MLKSVSFGALLALGAATGAHALTVTPAGDADTLANTILGSGVTITSKIYTGDPEASGTFTGGVSSGIGIDTGIILTSGFAASAVGPNNADGTTGNNSGGGAFGGIDESILEIKFKTETGSLFFNYVFASEEYNEFANTQFNDFFKFYLNGTAASNNIALIPGTSTPVEINTVNGGGPTFGVNPSNSGFFNNNDPSNGGPFFNIAYDGFTDVFTATATGLEKDFEYTITLVVGDRGDSNLDSAVFIQGGTFGGVKPPDPQPSVVPLPAGLPLLIGALGGLAVVRRRKRT